MKRMITSILTIAAVAVLAIGPSFAAAKDCCDGGACCNGGCCKMKHHTK